MSLLTRVDVVEMFDSCDYVFFITIKPPTERVHKIYEFMKYLDKRVDKYWLVRCTSENDFVHYHGVIAFHDNVTDSAKLKSAIHRWINRNMGFMQPLSMVRSLTEVYEYIKSDKNQPGEQSIKNSHWGYTL